MDFFLLLITLQLFVNLFFISRSKSGLIQDKLLKLYILIAGISVFSKFIVLSTESAPNLLVTVSSTFAFAALTHLYIRCVVTKQKISNKTILLHLLPFLFSILLFIGEIIIILFIPELKNHEAVLVVSKLALYFRLTSLVIYFFADMYYVFKSPDRRQFLSFKTDKVLVAVFIINKFVLMGIITAGLLHYNVFSFLAFLQNLVISSLIMYYRVFLPYQDKIAEQQRMLKELIFKSEANDTKPKYHKVEYDAEKLQTFVSTVESYLENDRPYLDMDLTFDQLSDETGISKHDLSYVLNQHLNTNFYQLINYKRVDYFLEHIHEIETESKSILALAYESGFSSKSTFNKYFKLHTGTSPSDYLKNKENFLVKIP